MSVRWSGRGRARLLEQVAKIAAEDPAAATRWLTKVEDHVPKTAGTLPKLGRIVPELGTDGRQRSE
jgi:plasmid stabilization system protein ParE